MLCAATRELEAKNKKLPQPNTIIKWDVQVVPQIMDYQVVVKTTVPAVLTAVTS